LEGKACYPAGDALDKVICTSCYNLRVKHDKRDSLHSKLNSGNALEEWNKQLDEWEGSGSGSGGPAVGSRSTNSSGAGPGDASARGR